MESITHLFSSLPHSRESALHVTASVEGNPNLAAGLLLGYVFMGLATYIWVFWSQRSRLEGLRLTLSCQIHGLKNVQKIQGNLLPLLFIDFVNAVTAIIIAIGFLTSTCNSELHCEYVVIAWYLSRCFGFILHLLNTWVCLIFLCHPERGVNQWWIYLPLIKLGFIFIPAFILQPAGTMTGLQVMIIVFALLIPVKCVVSTAASPSNAIWKKLIVLVAMLTFLIVFTPTFILEWLMITMPVEQHFMNALFYTNFQLLLDGLLCYCFLKLPSEDQQQQQQEHQRQPMTFENQIYNVSSNVNVPTLNMSRFASQQLSAVGGGSSSV
uniref:uncharacterized protein LOC117246477 n=1 Tax=Epinephelus lanceolatus TaxID=310571 RepID=UPI00144745C2|nr:uncharacterized protein LOC117246477 [Epinephelus lanceolatus]